MRVAGFEIRASQGLSHSGQDLEAGAFPHCYGGAWYEARPGWHEFEMNLHGILGLSGKTLTVRVHGDVVGHLQVHSGCAHLHRHDRGLPTTDAGNGVRVRTGSGTLVGSGRLHRVHRHGMM